MRKHMRMYMCGTLPTHKGHFLYLSSCFNSSPKYSQCGVGWGDPSYSVQLFWKLSAPQNFKKRQTMFFMNVNGGNLQEGCIIHQLVRPTGNIVSTLEGISILRVLEKASVARKHCRTRFLSASPKPGHNLLPGPYPPSAYWLGVGCFAQKPHQDLLHRTASKVNSKGFSHPKTQSFHTKNLTPAGLLCPFLTNLALAA